MKVCSKCKNKLDSSLFHKGNGKDGLAYRCKTCHKAYQSNKLKGKEYRTKRANKRKERIKNRMIRIGNIKTKTGCVDCGYNKSPVALQFDHIMGDKVGAICDLASRGVGWETIENEINKCEVRCANCHSIKSSKQFNRYNLS